jgi:Xaa-Pro aminopeptidase
MIGDFTRVLKGHIAIARAKFPLGTKGCELDILARFHLWQAKKDYAHGTGHGVGSFSGVHEAPPSISKRSDGIALQAGMILSNEPGYYEVGKYGIRIENLMRVIDLGDGFLGFETLTCAPLDPKLIDFKMMTYPEKKWLSNYHQEIYKKLKDILVEDEKHWLINLIKNNYSL